MKDSGKFLAAVVVALGCAQALFAAGNPAFGDMSLSDRTHSIPTVSAPASSGRFPAGAPPAHGYTAEQRAAMAAHNSSLGLDKNSAGDAPERIYRPYADYEAPGYLIMSADFDFDSLPAKLAAAANMPADATLVIFATYAENVRETILSTYGGVVPRSRIKVISLNGSGHGFWARDGIPVPVLDANNRLVVVDARYGKGFEPDAGIARLFRSGLEKHDYYYEGGNFMANSLGDCLMVNHGAHANIPDGIFTGKYGCASMTRLPFIDGIGHVDEHVRFVSEKTLLTDIPAYKDLLAAKGFAVHMLPKTPRAYETYVNSLIMNDKAVVPVYGRPSDAEALAVYRKLGFTPVGVDSASLSHDGLGSVHCITMTYPRVPAPELLKALGAAEINQGRPGQGD